MSYSSSLFIPRPVALGIKTRASTSVCTFPLIRFKLLQVCLFAIAWHLEVYRTEFRSSVGAFGWRVKTGASRGPNFRMGPPSRARVFRIGAPMTFGESQPKVRLLRTNR